MAKAAAVQYACSECGYATGKWLGRCPGCGAWSTLAEERAPGSTRGKSKSAVRPVLRLVPYVVPLLLLPVLPRAAAPLVGGDTFHDLAEVWPTALVAAEVVAAGGAVVVATRLLALARLRHSGGRGVTPRTER